jgi:pyrimidine-nucleoside phosphorylase
MTAMKPQQVTREASSSCTAPGLIADKRDGQELSASAITWLVRAYARDEVTDYQMSAFSMAVYLRGMTQRETAALTLAMAHSGKRLRLRVGRGAKVDKHSTGGVGDKVSICLAPLVAECGVRVPMIAGRGLGHTGGTVDKLEAIPGFRTDLSLADIEQLVATHGFALGAASADLAPVDRKLYALRDVTATVESVPLITASILSKKLCEDVDALVLDVKVGRGAFMKTLEQARALSTSLIRVGALAGLPVRALITRMDQPLGRSVGNALETAEALALLCGNAPDDLMECTLALGVEMLLVARVARTRLAAERKLQGAIRSGGAAARMERLIAAQGGDPRVVREPDRLPCAPQQMLVSSSKTGYVRDVDAMRVAEIALRLGAGRTRADQSIDSSVGIELLKKPGEHVRRGEVLARVHAAERSVALAEAEALLQAYSLGARPPVIKPIVIERL